MLAEGDKSNPLALEYWFGVVDLDSDGALRARECAFFYEEQLQRMECLNQSRCCGRACCARCATSPRPERGGVITMRDLRRCKLAGNFFNVLFNLNKFIAFESRDPFSNLPSARTTTSPVGRSSCRCALSMEEEEGAEGDDGWDDAAGDENGSSF